jgi:hypothetical protein
MPYRQTELQSTVKGDSDTGLRQDFEGTLTPGEVTGSLTGSDQLYAVTTGQQAVDLLPDRHGDAIDFRRISLSDNSNAQTPDSSIDSGCEIIHTATMTGLCNSFMTVQRRSYDNGIQESLHLLRQHE